MNTCVRSYYLYSVQMTRMALPLICGVTATDDFRAQQAWQTNLQRWRDEPRTHPARPVGFLFMLSVNPGGIGTQAAVLQIASGFRLPKRGA